jgi:hypothetical protein
MKKRIVTSAILGAVAFGAYAEPEHKFQPPAARRRP